MQSEGIRIDRGIRWVRGRLPESVLARLREWGIRTRLLLRSPIQKVCVGFVMVLLFVAFLAPYIAPHPESIHGAVSLENALQGPSLDHLFGTDEFGRDLFSRVLYGTRISAVAGSITVLLCMAIGVPLGAIAGTVGGVIDDVIMRIVDIFLSFPPLLLALVVSALLGPSLRNAILAITISWWPWYTRLVRGQAVAIRERQFARSARSMGAKQSWIVFRHVLPNAMGPTIVQAALDLGAVIMTLAALSFLGLGAQPPTPEWGLLVNQGRQYFLNAWWLIMFPGLAITLAVLAVNIVGDGIGEVLDPKSRTQ